VQTTATAKNGDYVIDGLKLFTNDAAAATDIIVAARTGKEADPAKGISLFVVDSKSAGVSIRRLPGFLTGRTFEVKLDSVKVPKSAILGNNMEGWPSLQQAIEKAIPVLCAYKVGGSQMIMDLALEHTRTREQFGQPVGRFQRVQDMIIEMLDHVEGARWTTYEALWKLDTQRPAKQSVHLAKIVASEGYFEVVTLAHRAFSGISYSKEHPVSFHTRASRALYTFLGDPAYHRQQLARFLVPLAD
jgi:alkylation response protein AidB-like acyl-CoA dehydrogenase